MSSASPWLATWETARPKAAYWSAAVLVAPLFLLALYIYGHGLGKRSLSIDELYHVYAADSLNRDGTFALPSGRPYERAAPYTYAVGLSFKYLGVSEFSARIPSVLFGLLYLALFFRLVDTSFGRGAAVLSALLVVLSPLEVYYARECRFYSLLQVSYLVLVYSFFKLFETFREAQPAWDSRRVRKLVLLSLVFAVAGYLCLKMQAFGTLLFLPSVALFVVFTLINTFFARRSAPPLKFALTAAGVLATAVAGLYLSTELLGAAFFQSFTYVPRWASYFAGDRLFYFRVLYHQNALLCLLVPVGALLAMRGNAAGALYFGSLFAAPFMILSFLPLKQDRLLHHVYPFALVLISVCIVVSFGKIMEILRLRTGGPKRWMTALLLIGTITALAANTAFAYGRFKISFPPTPGWKETCSSLRSGISGDDIVVTDNSIAVRHYLGRVDYVMDENLLEISKQAGCRDRSGRWRDYYTDAVHITSIGELMELAGGGKRAWILLGHDGSGFRSIHEFAGTIGKPITGDAIDEEIKVYSVGPSFRPGLPIQ